MDSLDDSYLLTPTALLPAVEELVLDEKTLVYFRIFGWWVLVQSWSALRFSDHRGIVPSQVEIDALGFTARLTHSKTLGSDRNDTMRLVVVDKNCFVQRDGWMSPGWRTTVSAQGSPPLDAAQWLEFHAVGRRCFGLPEAGA